MSFEITLTEVPATVKVSLRRGNVTKVTVKQGDLEGSVEFPEAGELPENFDTGGDYNVSIHTPDGEKNVSVYIVVDSGEAKVEGIEG
jgi:hypothetical protein